MMWRQLQQPCAASFHVASARASAAAGGRLQGTMIRRQCTTTATSSWSGRTTTILRRRIPPSSTTFAAASIVFPARYLPPGRWQPPTTVVRPFASAAPPNLGHSPMGAAPLPFASQSTEIPTREEAEIGGVWVKESAQRDKLLELKSELANATADNAVPSLDAAATERQRRDLWLVDGLQLLCRQTEQLDLLAAPSETATTETESTTTSDDDMIARQTYENLAPVRQAIHAKLDQLPEQLHQVQWEEVLLDVQQELTQALQNVVPPGRCLGTAVRDYCDASFVMAAAETQQRPLSEAVRQWIEEQQQQSVSTSTSDDPQQSQQQQLTRHFTEAVTRVRLQTTRAVAEHLQTSWKDLVHVTDQDVDRAAVRHEIVGDRTTLPRAQLRAVLDAHLVGAGDPDRWNAWWRLVDHDRDELLDAEQVQFVARLAVAPVQTAVQTILQEALDAGPVSGEIPVGWRQRRRETKDKKQLRKLLDRAVQRFFAEDLQQPHRLRCVYAWANKAHQNGKVDSVLVEEEENAGVGTTLMGRKRYVELQPKISLAEFREVQAIHFPQLDRVGSELLASYRDDLLVDQGKGRQRTELWRDCALFFVGVCVADYAILAL